MKIITTLEELAALDPDTIVIDRRGDMDQLCDWIENGVVSDTLIHCLPVIILIEGKQVRDTYQELTNHKEYY